MRPFGRIFHELSCSADYQVCCIAGFQTRERRSVSTPCRFGNRRYSRFGNLRYASFARARQSNYEISKRGLYACGDHSVVKESFTTDTRGNRQGFFDSSNRWQFDTRCHANQVWAADREEAAALTTAAKKQLKKTGEEK